MVFVICLYGHMSQLFFKPFQNNANQEEMKLSFKFYRIRPEVLYMWYKVSLWSNTELIE
jgi:hypothetical protein